MKNWDKIKLITKKGDDIEKNQHYLIYETLG